MIELENERPRQTHPALDRMLRRIADAGGRLEYPENEERFSPAVLDDAQQRGLVRVGTDGALGVMEVLTLTDAGREVAGMPPLFDLVLWFRRHILRR